jgi:hypothetical protein
MFRCFDKLYTGKIMLKDLIFAKEVRLGTYRGNNIPPSAQVAWRKYMRDNNYLPRYKEREPYIVVNNNMKINLKEKVMSPDEFVANKDIYIDHTYYISKQIIPAIKRILEPCNVDIDEWFNTYKRLSHNANNIYYIKSERSKTDLVTLGTKADSKKSKTIHNYFDKSEKDIENKRQETIRYQHIHRYETLIEEIVNESEMNEEIENFFKFKNSQKQFEKLKQYEMICRFCSEVSKYNISVEEVPCVNLYCKIFYDKLYCKNNL